MERYVCFVDDKGFVVYNAEDEKITYSLHFGAATEAYYDDWTILGLRFNIYDYHLLKPD